MGLLWCECFKIAEGCPFSRYLHVSYEYLETNAPTRIASTCIDLHPYKGQFLGR